MSTELIIKDQTHTNPHNQTQTKPQTENQNEKILRPKIIRKTTDYIDRYNKYEFKEQEYDDEERLKIGMCKKLTEGPVINVKYLSY